MKLKMKLILVLMLLPTLLFAADMGADMTCDDQYGGSSGNMRDLERVAESACEPDASKLAGICNDVRGGRSDSYERKILEAACVSTSDSSRDIQRKVQDMWDRFDSRLRCDGANFSVSHGSILKYAVSVRTYDFLSLAVNTWGVDINRADPSDGKTVLQFVESEIERNRGRPAESELQSYRDLLIRSSRGHRR